MAYSNFSERCSATNEVAEGLLAQLAYDIEFALPASPPSPEVSVTAMRNEILLSWDDMAESYNQIDVID